MQDREKRALGALASMVSQYLHEDEEPGLLDSRAMSAGEHAINALAEYGYMELIERNRTFGRWTPAGAALLRWNYPYAEQATKPFPEPTP